MNKNLTREKLYKILQENKFIAVRWCDGFVAGINCSIAIHAANKYKIDKTRTALIGFYPISFHEYVRIKIPFIKT